jgi:hypothetical protein
MEITYAGDSAFKLAGSKIVTINNPTAGKGEISLFSRRQRSPRLLVNGPGEYEIGGVLIVTVPVGTGHAERWAHAIALDDSNIFFLEGEVEGLTETSLLAIGPVDVLIVQAEKLTETVKLAQDLAPRLVIPFGTHASAVCAALGVKDAAPASRLNLNGKCPRAALLKAPRASARKRTAA